jgi:26S proteasome non-ATPase regulatory subunit 10
MKRVLSLVTMAIFGTAFTVIGSETTVAWTGSPGGLWVPTLTVFALIVMCPTAKASDSGSANTNAKAISHAVRGQQLSAPAAGVAGQPLSRSPIGERNELHEATRRGDAAAVRRLLAEGADPNQTDSLGRTALHYAVSKGYLEVVEILLDGGAEVNPPDQDGFQPLHRAAQSGHKAMAERLIRHGADLEARTKGGDRPLDIAMRNKDQAMMELLQKQAGKD